MNLSGIISDDRHAQGATISRMSDVPPGVCRVTVYETTPPKIEGACHEGA